MKLLKKPVVAILLVVLLVVGSTLLSADLKLSRACARVTDGFYDGVKRQPAAAQAIRSLCDDADQMVIIGDNYGIDTSPLSADTSALRQAVGFDNPDVAAVYAAFAPFYTKLKVLENDLQHTDLSERHEEQMAEYTQDIARCHEQIDASGYNESVSTFLRRNNRFPTRQFARLFNITYPAYFA